MTGPRTKGDIELERSEHRILTTHAGSLSRPLGLVEAYKVDASAESLDPILHSSISEVIQKQQEAHIDVINDGEFGKPTKTDVDYAAWGSYIFDRLDGYTLQQGTANIGPRSSKDRADFREFYESGEILGGGGNPHHGR